MANIERSGTALSRSGVYRPLFCFFTYEQKHLSKESPSRRKKHSSGRGTKPLSGSRYRSHPRRLRITPVFGRWRLFFFASFFRHGNQQRFSSILFLHFILRTLYRSIRFHPSCCNYAFYFSPRKIHWKRTG